MWLCDEAVAMSTHKKERELCGLGMVREGPFSYPVSSSWDRNGQGGAFFLSSELLKGRGYWYTWRATMIISTWRAECYMISPAHS